MELKETVLEVKKARALMVVDQYLGKRIDKSFSCTLIPILPQQILTHYHLGRLDVEQKLHVQGRRGYG